MATKPIGRRAAQYQKQPTTVAPTVNVTFGGPVAKSAVLPDGEYTGRVEKLEFRQSKKGALVAVVTFISDDAGKVRLQPLMVGSQGGDSELIVNNRAILSAMAGIGEDRSVTPDELIKVITGAECWVRLIEVTDKDGEPINRITNAGTDVESVE